MPSAVRSTAARPTSGPPASLLDRLLDEPPITHPGPGGRSGNPGDRGDGGGAYRAAILRDLAWLFNTTRPTPAASAGSFVARSVVHYGLPPLAGRRTGEDDAFVLARALREAIVRFEPRLRPEAVRVRPESGARGAAGHRLRFLVEAELAGGTAGDRWLLRTEVDLDTGHAMLDELR